ncbi:hypothetical protein [Thermocrinis sp.]
MEKRKTISATGLFGFVLSLLLSLSSLAQDMFLKVLYRDGRVGVVDTRKVSVSSLKARGYSRSLIFYLNCFIFIHRVRE